MSEINYKEAYEALSDQIKSFVELHKQFAEEAELKQQEAHSENMKGWQEGRADAYRIAAEGMEERLDSTNRFINIGLFKVN